MYADPSDHMMLVVLLALLGWTSVLEVFHYALLLTDY